MSGRSSLDVVIAGAGAAGIGAARTARSLGLRFLVFEALGRTGGRALTDHRTFGFPWDLGCHWLHSGSVNPLREVADRLGHHYRTSSLADKVWAGHGWASEVQQRELLASAERCYEAVLAVGNEGRDVPASEVVDPAEPGSSLFRSWMSAEWGTALEEISTLDAARYRDTDENWPVENGYGALIAQLAEGVPVELETPVERIDWRGEPARIVTSNGTVEASAVIITVSTDVLAGGSIQFDPPLPYWKLEAAAAIPLGRANKVGFAIAAGDLGVDEPTEIAVPVAGGTLMTFRLRPFGRHLADGYLAGSLCKDLEARSREAMIETARDALVAALGSRVGQRITATACSHWGAEPTIRGAYAAARPGQADRREDLGRPVADRLYFAGEATSPDFYSTCHGAYASGIVAAYDVGRALGIEMRHGSAATRDE